LNTAGLWVLVLSWLQCKPTFHLIILLSGYLTYSTTYMLMTPRLTSRPRKELPIPYHYWTTLGCICCPNLCHMCVCSYIRYSCHQRHDFSTKLFTTQLHLTREYEDSVW
jgi:hypothetical protein